MTQAELDLLHDYLDGTISVQDLSTLQSLLRESAEARQMLRTLCTVDTKLLECAAADPTNLRLVATPEAQAQWSELSSRQPDTRLARFQLRPLTAAAAGLLFGMLCTSMAWAYVRPFASKAMTLFQESFESGRSETVPGLPLQVGVWSGDEARVVEAEKGIKPKDGLKMLRFISATYAGENAKRSAWGDVYRLVDLRGQVGSPKSLLRLSGSFDAAGFSPGEEYSCSVELCALESEISEAPQPLTLPWVRENSASVALRKFPMKGDGAWQDAVVEVPVSPQTRFVLAHLTVLRRKPFPPAKPVQFCAHYLDAVKLELLPRASTP